MQTGIPFMNSRSQELYAPTAFIGAEFFMHAFSHLQLRRPGLFRMQSHRWQALPDRLLPAPARTSCALIQESTIGAPGRNTFSRRM